MKTSTVISVSAVFLVAAAFAFQKSVKLPPPFHSPSSNNPPRVISRPDGAQLRLPAGFDIDEYADGFERPRFMLQGPSGEILLSDSVEGGSVYALLDKNKDFKADERKVLLRGLDRPYGLAFWNRAIVLSTGDFVHQQAGCNGNILGRFGFQVKSETVCEKRVIFNLIARLE